MKQPLASSGAIAPLTNSEKFSISAAASPRASGRNHPGWRSSSDGDGLLSRI
jgi:hypothetical protein